MHTNIQAYWRFLFILLSGQLLSACGGDSIEWRYEIQGVGDVFFTENQTLEVFGKRYADSGIAEVNHATLDKNGKLLEKETFYSNTFDFPVVSDKRDGWYRLRVATKNNVNSLMLIHSNQQMQENLLWSVDIAHLGNQQQWITGGTIFIDTNGNIHIAAVAEDSFSDANGYFYRYENTGYLFVLSPYGEEQTKQIFNNSRITLVGVSPLGVRALTVSEEGKPSDYRFYALTGALLGRLDLDALLPTPELFDRRVSWPDISATQSENFVVLAHINGQVLQADNTYESVYRQFLLHVDAHGNAQRSFVLSNRYEIFTPVIGVSYGLNRASLFDERGNLWQVASCERYRYYEYESSICSGHPFQSYQVQKLNAETGQFDIDINIPNLPIKETYISTSGTSTVEKIPDILNVRDFFIKNDKLWYGSTQSTARDYLSPTGTVIRGARIRLDQLSMVDGHREKQTDTQDSNGAMASRIYISPSNDVYGSTANYLLKFK